MWYLLLFQPDIPRLRSVSQYPGFLPPPNIVIGRRQYYFLEHMLAFAKVYNDLILQGELYPSINELVGDSKTFIKHAFGSKELGQYIEKKNYDEIYLCGLVSDICVFSNAVIAKSFASPYCRIKIVRDATSSYDLSMQEKAFDVLKHLHMEII